MASGQSGARDRGLPPVTSRTSLRMSTIRNQCRSWGKPSSSALRSCRATFFLHDSCRLKYFTSLLCRDRGGEGRSQRHRTHEEQRWEPRAAPSPSLSDLQFKDFGEIQLSTCYGMERAWVSPKVPYADVRSPV